ncbi:Fanconi anemia group I protein [Nymphaea thermarum]|nr:Fanconi anemia group I protein [Nymphaea thermarum]
MEEPESEEVSSQEPLPPITDDEVRLHGSSPSALSSFLSDSPENASLHLSFLISFLRLFFSRNIPPNPQTISLISQSLLPSLPVRLLPSLMETLISLFQEAPTIDSDLALPLDLIPVALYFLQSTPSLRIPGCHDQVPAIEYVDSVLDRILELEWTHSFLLRITHLLREFPFGERKNSRSSEFLLKVFAVMEGVDPQDVPPLVYKILILASKGFDRKVVANGIVGFFSDARAWPALVRRQVEGTTLLHLDFVVKQDPLLGQQFLNTLRSSPERMSHFGVAMLLSFGRIRRFAEASMSVLRIAVLNSHRDHRLASVCKWLPDNVKETCFKSVKMVEQTILRAIHESGYGREYIIPNIVELGFLLLESAGRSDETKDDELLGVEGLGIQTLKTLFDVHDIARNEVIEQCKFRILSLKPQQSVPIIKLLSRLVQSYPYPLLEHVAHLKELLDYFTFMHSGTALSIFIALLPLTKLSHDLKRYMILVVRKAVFRREIEVRVSATSAIVHLILSEQKIGKMDSDSVSEISSQASCSQQAEPPGKTKQPLDHSWSCFGFSLSQENEPGGVSCAEAFANAVLQVRKYFGTVRLEDILTKEVDVQSLDGQTTSYHAFILLGILEVLVNAVATDLEKAKEGEKNQYEKELYNFLNLYDSIEKVYFPKSTKNGSKRKRVNSTSSDMFNAPNCESKEGHENELLKLSQRRSPFLSTVSVQHLFMMVMQNGDESHNCQAVSQNHRQTSQHKPSACHSKLIRFVLNACLRQLKTCSSMASDDPLKALIYGDIKSLGFPLLQLVCLLESHLDTEKIPKIKEAKEKRAFDDGEGVLLDIALLLGKILPCSLANSIGEWANHMCRTTNLANPKASQSLSAVAIYLSSSPNDLAIACNMASELLKVIGTEEEEPIKESKVYLTINNLTGNAVATLILHSVEYFLVDLEWAILKWKTVSRDSSLHLEAAFCARAEAVVSLASQFAEMNLKDPHAEQFLKLAARIYKNLACIAKFCIASKGYKQTIPSNEFQKLVEVTCKKLTCSLYNFMALKQGDQQEVLKKKGVVNKIRRETKCIPNLVFQIEDYEKYLIKLSKLTKVNLLRHAKRSTARDFKILDIRSMNDPGASGRRSSQASHDECQKGSDDESEEEENEDAQDEGGSGSPESAEEGKDDDSNEECTVLRTKRTKRNVVKDSEDDSE